MQSTTVVTNYYSNQLKIDTEREERILLADLTRVEAVREDAEWQQVRDKGSA